MVDDVKSTSESISHSFGDETIEAKAKWFQSLSLEERMNVFVAFTNLIIENSPGLLNQKKIRPTLKDVRTLAATTGNLHSED